MPLALLSNVLGGIVDPWMQCSDGCTVYVQPSPQGQQHHSVM